MSKKQHIYPNGTRVNVLFEGSVVGTGTVISHLLEPDDMFPNKQNLYYQVRVDLNDFEKFLNMPQEHILNDFEVRPIRD